MKADQYGIPLRQFYRDFSLQEINQLQALDNLKDEKYVEKITTPQHDEFDPMANASAIKAILQGAS